MTSALHVAVVALAWAAVVCFYRGRRPGAPWTLPCALGLCSTAVAAMAEKAAADLGRVATTTLTQAWIFLAGSAVLALITSAFVTERLIIRSAPALAVIGLGLQSVAIVDGGSSRVALITLGTPFGPVVPIDLARLLVVIAAVGIAAPAAPAIGLGFSRNPWRGRLAVSGCLFVVSMLLSIAAKDTSGMVITAIATVAFAHSVLDRPALTGGLIAGCAFFAVVVFTQVSIAADRLHRWVNVAAPGPVEQELAALFAARSGGTWGVGDLLGMRSLGPAWLSDYMPAGIIRYFGSAGGILLLFAGVIGGLGMLRAARTGRTRTGRNLAGTIGVTFLCHIIGAWAAALAALPETGIASPFHTLSDTSLIATGIAVGVVTTAFPAPRRALRLPKATEPTF